MGSYHKPTTRMMVKSIKILLIYRLNPMPKMLEMAKNIRTMAVPRQC
jgi:hypothetical protein